MDKIVRPACVFASAVVLLAALAACSPIGNTINEDINKTKDATLTSLSIDAGALSPTFAKGVQSYTATVTGVTSITVTAVKTQSGASIQVRVNAGQWGDVASGNPSQALALSVGLNLVEARVISPDGSTTGTYSIYITRIPSSALLGGLAISAGTLAPAFSSGTFTYGASVSNATTSVHVSPTLLQVGGAIDVRFNGQSWQAVASGANSPDFTLSVGDNSIDIRVTPPDSSAVTYTVTVHRRSNNANLATLSMSPYTLSPPFSPATTAYTATVPVDSISLWATGAETGQALAARTNLGSWQAATSGSPYQSASLNVGAGNTVDMQVTAEDGNTKTYTITIYRQSPNADLSNLTASVGGLVPMAFSPSTLSYVDVLLNTNTNESIRPTQAESHASLQYRVNNGSWTGTLSGNAILLTTALGNTKLDIQVTAENSATKTYSVLIQRRYPGLLNEVFQPGTGTTGGTSSVGVYCMGTILNVPDLRAIIGGNFTSYNGTPANYLAAVKPDGSIDAAFNSGGSGPSSLVQQLAIVSGNKIVIAGSFGTYNGVSRKRIARLNTDGTLDTTFNPGTGANYAIFALAVQQDGKYIIGGDFTSYNGTPVNRLARINSDGTLDTTFNVGTGLDTRVYSIGVQSDGKIVVGGAFTSYNGTTKKYLARCSSSGSLDTSFPAAGAPDGWPWTIREWSGLYLVGSFSNFGSTARHGIARLNMSDGSIDTAFDPGSGFDGAPLCIDFWDMNRQYILVGGAFTTYNGTTCNGIAALNFNGTLYSAFTDSNPGFAGATGNAMIYAFGQIDVYTELVGGVFSTYKLEDRPGMAMLWGE
jgi:uncharacterized delta-60 repeat protein